MRDIEGVGVDHLAGDVVGLEPLDHFNGAGLRERSRHHHQDGDRLEVEAWHCGHADRVCPWLERADIEDEIRAVDHRIGERDRGDRLGDLRLELCGSAEVEERRRQRHRHRCRGERDVADHVESHGDVEDVGPCCARTRRRLEPAGDVSNLDDFEWELLPGEIGRNEGRNEQLSERQSVESGDLAEERQGQVVQHVAQGEPFEIPGIEGGDECRQRGHVPHRSHRRRQVKRSIDTVDE